MTSGQLVLECAVGIPEPRIPSQRIPKGQASVPCIAPVAHHMDQVGASRSPPKHKMVGNPGMLGVVVAERGQRLDVGRRILRLETTHQNVKDRLGDESGTLVLP